MSTTATAQDAATQEADEVEAEFSADEAARLDEAARTLFEAGRSAFSEARYENALTHFERAYAISERSLLLYNIAQTQDRLRRDRDAIATFERFLESDPPADIGAIAERRLNQLRAQLAPTPEETAVAAQPAPQIPIDEPASSNTGLIIGVTVASIVVVVTAIVLGLVLRDDGPNEVRGTVGDVYRTLRVR